MENIKKAKNPSQWQDALDGLPHGEGFRFLDRLIQLEPGVSGKAEWDVREDLPFFPGHFPGNPLVPGVIMIEAVAQLAGVVASTLPESPAGFLLTAVRSVKISGTTSPGGILLVSAEIKGSLGGVVQAAGTVSEGERELMRGEIVLTSTGKA